MSEDNLGESNESHAHKLACFKRLGSACRKHVHSIPCVFLELRYQSSGRCEPRYRRFLLALMWLDLARFNAG